VNYGIIFDLDPAIIHLGPLQIRYYGLIFVLMFLLGWLLWRRQMLRGRYSLEMASEFIIYGILAVLIGSRLGHCLFYDTAFYLSHPLKILYVWEGGLSSHGAALGVIIALIFFARKYNLPVMEVFDRFTFSAATGAAMIRLGNFLNSEIVGRATDVPWAVRFVRYDNGIVARHPSQLYEFALGILVFFILYIADRISGGEKRPRGLLTGLFFICYFGGRFFVEFYKEYQTLTNSYLTMGQYLSIIPFSAGVWILSRIKYIK